MAKLYNIYAMIVYFATLLPVTIFCLVVSIFLPVRFKPRFWMAAGRLHTRLFMIIGFIDIRQRGSEHIPPETAIFAGDHRSLMDTFALIVALKRYFFMLTAPLDIFPSVLRLWIRRMGFISIFRDDDDKAKYRMAVIRQEAVFESVRRLKDGQSMVIYPEGHHEHYHKLLKFHTGAVRFAIEAQVPIIPIAIIGTDYILSPERNHLNPGIVFIRFGKPIYYDKYKGKVGNRRLIKRLTKELREEISKLLHEKR